MTEEILHNLYRIEVPLKGNPLKALNAYFIRGGESDLLIDTGFRTEECFNALKAGLNELHYDPERMDVMLTHFHADHSGLCDLIVDPSRHVFMQENEYAFEKTFPMVMMFNDVKQTYRKEGFIGDVTREPGRAEYIRADYTKDVYLTYKEGDVFEIGDYTLEPVHVPGHTPNNSMLYDRKHKLMFTGDHVLFDITPNIPIFPGTDNSLGDYLNSLKKAEQYDVEIAIPGHRKTGNYYERIAQLQKHHEERLEEVKRIIRDNPLCTAYEIAAQMQWRIHAKNWAEFPMTQKWFAMGECISHVRYLVYKGDIGSQIREDGIRVYSI